MRRNHSSSKKARLIAGLSVLQQAVRSGSASHRALVACRRISVNQSLPGRAIERLSRQTASLGIRARSSGLLERRPEGGPLRPVAHGGRARLAHVLLGGRNIWHEGNLRNELSDGAGRRWPRSNQANDSTTRMSRRHIALTRLTWSLVYPPEALGQPEIRTVCRLPAGPPGFHITPAEPRTVWTFKAFC
jgi:hypothetical protein